MESSTVPPGFRFHPTDEELVGYYLRKKIASQKIDLDVIREIDLYRIEPWDLIETCRIGYEEQNEWYFFSHKDKKYPTGTRTNRATIAGFWKATGRDKAVYSKTKLIGMRKTLVFYKGRAPNGQKTEWIMHEYRLESDDQNGSPQEEGWVVCRAFKKRTTTTTNNGQNKNNVEVWDSSYFYEDQSNGSISSIVDPLHDYVLSKQPKKFLPPTNFIYYKQENIEADSLSSFMMKSDQQEQFVQLPQLESPSFPLIKRSSPSLISLYDDQEDQDQQNFNNKINNKKVTDWRALDKFVASQLSQEDNIGESSFSGEGHRDSNEIAPLLLQRSRDEDHKLNACDIGICMFEKLRN